MEQVIIIKDIESNKEYGELVDKFLSTKEQVTKLQEELKNLELELSTLMVNNNIKTIGYLAKSKKVTIIPSSTTQTIDYESSLIDNGFDLEQYEVTKTKTIKELDYERVLKDIPENKLKFKVKTTKPSFKITQLKGDE